MFNAPAHPKPEESLVSPVAAVPDASQFAGIPAARHVRPNIALAKALGEARAVGVPGWAVAAEAGISASLLSMITRGGARASEVNARAIAQALGRDPRELFSDVVQGGGR